MAPPPLMLLVAAGVGLTALLYYYFVSKEERTAVGTAYSYESPGSRSGRRRSRCNNDRGDIVECSICQELVFNESSVRTLACGHSFHYRCIDKWFEASPCPNCPNCRQPVR